MTLIMPTLNRNTAIMAASVSSSEAMLYRRKPMIRPVAVASAIILASLIVSAKAETITFGGGEPGALPQDFTSALTGNGAVGR